MTRLDTPSATTEAVAGRAAEHHIVDPALLLEREICLLRLRRPDLDVEMSDAETVLVSMDPDQLLRAFGNLLENAATVSPTGGQIRVDRSLHHGRLSIRFTDSGPGVAPADRGRIFDRFVRLSTSRTGAGSGLGLPISRAIVRAGGGELECLPWTGGACFELVLPARPRTTATPPGAAQQLQPT